MLSVNAPAGTSELSGKAGGGGVGLGTIIGLALLVAMRLRRMLSVQRAAALALLMLGGQASAQEASAPLQFDWQGSYVGLRAGEADYTLSSARLDADLASAGESSTGTSLTQHRAGGVVFAGVPFIEACLWKSGLRISASIR